MLIDLQVGSSILKLYDKDIFNKEIKVYYGLKKEDAVKKIDNDRDRSDFLKRVYKTFPYCYLDKIDPENNTAYYRYYTFQDSIDEDILEQLELKEDTTHSWNNLNPNIGVRLLTSYIKSSYNLNSILKSKSYKNVKVKLENGYKEITLPITHNFEIRTIGYDYIQGEITLGMVRRLNMNAVSLYIFKELGECNFRYIIDKLRSLAKNSVKDGQRKVRIYSKNQPNSGTAAVIDIIFGNENIKKFLEDHQKGAFYVERTLKELGKSLEDVECLLIGVYNNKIPLKMAKNDDRYQYYFTEYNAYLVLTPEIQEKFFNGFNDSWKKSIIEEYKKKLQEITSLPNFKYCEGVKGVPVDLKERILIRTYEGFQAVDNIYSIFNPSILNNMLPISQDILKKAKKHKLHITIVCPEKYCRNITETYFYRKLEQFKEGLFSNTFASVDDIEVISVKGEDVKDYINVMEEVNFDEVQDYTLGVVIFPEQYDKRDLRLKKFYNKLKERFYSEDNPLVFQGARINTIFDKKDKGKYASYNLLLQIPPKLGIYPYSLERYLDYNYIIGIDYTYWYEGDTVSLGGGAVIVSPSGIIEDVYPIAIPSNAESLDMAEILTEWFNKVVKKKEDILDKDKITLLISRDGRIPKYERQTIQDFLKDFSGDIDIKIEAVEVRKRIAVRTWSSRQIAYYTPIKVGNYTYYLVDAHIGYLLKEKKMYYSSPYLIGNYYSFEKGKDVPILGNPRIDIIKSLIRLQKINYATTRVNNIKLPLPLSITHKLINFIRDTKTKIKKIGIPHSLFMI